MPNTQVDRQNRKWDLKVKSFCNKLKKRLGSMSDRSALYEIEKSILQNDITGFP